MNFFEAQDNARRKTWQLALLFIAAVASLIVLTNLLVAAVYLWSGSAMQVEATSLLALLESIPAETWLLISTGVLGVIGVASLYKYLLLRGGGRAIAEMLGGRLLTRETSDHKALRLLNIVEEMAIASGISVPPVYLIPEASINAFAAGLTPADAVIGINQGTIDTLDRDELQGVIAHEFSHIVNGDTRINLRLIAILHGIVFLSMIGFAILRGFRYGGRSRGSGNSAAPVVALAVGLLVIGYAGSFFGNLIKAAVSRQREYLADAAAVQFTRNPRGIADALKKIGGSSAGSKMTVAAASEASHMFFGQIGHLFLNGIMATHPPLEKRIRAVEPNWDGSFISPDAEAADVQAGSEVRGMPAGATGFAGDAAWKSDAVQVTASAATIVDQVGRLDEHSLGAAHVMIDSTDVVLREAAHDAWGARALIYTMLLDRDPALRRAQMDLLQDAAERGVPEYMEKLVDALDHTDAPHLLTLLNMSMPALKTLSGQQYKRFVANTVALIKHDKAISLFEWVLHRLLLKELKPHFEGPVRVPVRHKSVASVSDHAGTLLATIARVGHADDPPGGRAAFDAGAAELGLELTYSEADDPNFAGLNQAVRELRRLKPLLKPKLLKACAATTLADDNVTANEGALLQGISAALDCPLPPSIYSAR